MSVSRKQLISGLLLLTLAFGLGAVQNALVKSIAHKTSILAILFFQYFICLLFLLPSLKANKITMPSKKSALLLLGRTLAGLSYFGLMYLSLRYTTLVNVSILTNTAPFWVPIFSAILLKTPIRKHVYISLFIGFLGVILIVLPNIKGGFHFHNGDIIALASAIAMALAIISVNKLSQTENHRTMLFGYFLISSILTFPFAIIYWHSFSLIILAIMFVNAVLMFFHQIFVIKGFQYSAAPELAFSVYTSVPISALLGYFFWGEKVTLLNIAGILLIILSGGYIIATKSKD